MRFRTRRPLLLTAGLAAVALSAGGALPAAATSTGGDAFRFWGYYQQSDGQWEFAQTGPDGQVPGDGQVEGWRFATSALGDTRLPRATPTFEDLCGDTAAEDGSKRVAVVIDYGRAADAGGSDEPPAARGECAVVPSDATGAEVLASVATLRAEGGMTCGIDGWPQSGCGENVSPVAPEAAAADEPVQLVVDGQDGTDTSADAADNDTDAADGDDGGSLGTWLVLGAVVLVAALAGVGLLRRRRAED